MNKNPLFRFFKYMKYAKIEYCIGISLIILSSFLTIISTYIIAKVFNGDYTNAIINIKLFSIVTIALAIIEYFKRYYLAKASNKMYINMQKMIYDHIQNLPIKYFDNMSAGSIVSRTVNDVVSIKDFFDSTITFVGVIIFKLLFTYITLFFINYKMAIVLIIFFILMLIVKIIYEKIMIKNSTEYSKYNSYNGALINEGLQNLDIIKAFNNEQNILNEWDKISKHREKIGIKMVRTDATFLHNLTALFRDIILILTIIYFAKYKIEVGIVFLFIRYTLDVIDDVTRLIINLSWYTKAVGAASNLNEILNLEQEKKEIVTKDTYIEKFVSNIKFENVWFAYDEKEQILKDISFEINENETVAFVGRTGSGKSTILNLITKFYENQKGNIYISGKNLKDISKTYLRENIAIVLQTPFIFQGTVLENIVLNEVNRDLARQTLEKLDASTIDIEYVLESNGKNLSEGEKQLISFARALAKNPKILILDEATANIDSQTEKYIQDSIEKLKENRTTIIIAHRLSTIKNADKIFVLDKGRIVESGNHNELMKKNSYYARMYNNQK